MKIMAEAKIKSSEDAKTLATAFFANFHPDSMLSIKGYQAKLEVVFEESAVPRDTVDAIFSCCEAETIEFGYNNVQLSEKLPIEKGDEEAIKCLNRPAAAEYCNDVENVDSIPAKKKLGRNAGMDCDINQVETIRKIAESSKSFSDFIEKIAQIFDFGKTKDFFKKAIKAAAFVVANGKGEISWTKIENVFNQKGWLYNPYFKKLVCDTLADKLEDIVKCPMIPTSFIKLIAMRYGNDQYDFAGNTSNDEAETVAAIAESLEPEKEHQIENSEETETESVDTVSEEVKAEKANEAESVSEVTKKPVFECMPNIPAFEKKLEEMDPNQPIEQKVKYVLKAMGLAEKNKDQQEQILKIANAAVKADTIGNIETMLELANIEEDDKMHARMNFSEFVHTFISKHSSGKRMVHLVDFLRDLQKVVS